MKALIIGCGYLGRRVAAGWVDGGHTVTALTRNDSHAAELQANNIMPIVGDVRGAGYFFGIELVKDKATREQFSEDEAEEVLFDFVSPRLYENGLICRTDDRGEPVIQLSPPLVAGPEELREIARILRKVLTEASELMANIKIRDSHLKKTG